MQMRGFPRVRVITLKVGQPCNIYKVLARFYNGSPRSGRGEPAPRGELELRSLNAIGSSLQSAVAGHR